MEELIIKAQKGDIDAFTQIVLNIESDLYKIAKTRISNETDIQDAIQETMIEAYKSIKKLKDPNKFKKWMIKILINKCNRIYKRKYKQDISMDEYNLGNYILVNSYKNIEDDLNFYSLLKKLKYEERIVIILYYMEKYTIDEIAEITKMKADKIRTLLYRARQKIRISYKKEE